MSGKVAKEVKRQSGTNVEKREREPCPDRCVTVSSPHEKEKDNVIRSGRRLTCKEREERRVTEKEKRHQGKDVQLFVKTVDSKTMTIRLGPEESVGAPQRKIKHRTLCPSGDAYVPLAGKVLKEWDVLKDC